MSGAIPELRGSSNPKHPQAIPGSPGFHLRAIQDVVYPWSLQLGVTLSDQDAPAPGEQCARYQPQGLAPEGLSSSADTPGRSTEGGVRRCPSLGFFTPQAVTPCIPGVHDQATWMLASSEELDFPLLHYAKEEVARQMFLGTWWSVYEPDRVGATGIQKRYLPQLGQFRLPGRGEAPGGQAGKNGGWIRGSPSPHNTSVTTLPCCVCICYLHWALCAQRKHIKAPIWVLVISQVPST